MKIPLLNITSLLLAAMTILSASEVKAQVLTQESFDTLNETVLDGQNNWKSNGRSTIQTQFNAQVGGKALKIDAPDGVASKVLLPDGIDGIVAIDFKILLDPKEVEPSAKVLISLLDSDKKLITLFFHSEANQWGLKSGANYTHVKRKSDDGKWQAVRLVLNFNTKKLSVYVADGANWSTIFSQVKFDTESAKNFASIGITRNGQGNAAPVYVDEIAVQKIESDAPPVVAASVLTGDTPAKPRFAVFDAKETVEVVLEANRVASAPADSLEWQLIDWRGSEVRRGTLTVAGNKWSQAVKFDALPAGYYALKSRLRNQGDALPAQGSRPAGMLSFGVLPSVAPLPQVTVESARFGMWGTNFIKENEWLKGDPFEPLVTKSNAQWSSWSRKWSELEPNHAGEWKPGAVPGGEFQYALRHKMVYTVAMDGLPAWNIAWPPGVAKPEGKLDHTLSQAYPPADWDAYADFVSRVAREQVAVRKQHPYLKKSYYLLHHEPDWHWKGDDASFIKMYAVAHKALHAADPQAVLLGPRYGVLKNGIAHLERLFPLGLGKHLDGLGFHGYYLPPRLSETPEAAGTPDMIRRLRELTRQYIGPKAMMAQLEWGVRYDVAYEGITPDILRRHAAQTVRGHLIALGEGAQMSYLFYTSDYSGEPGYGLTFNLDMPEPNFGAIRVSPKPAYMAAAAMTRLLDGTTTLGRVKSGKALGYSFKRGSQYLLALWSPSGEAIPLKMRTIAQTVKTFDMMGQEQSTKGGSMSLTVNDNPVYLLSDSPIIVEN